MRLVERPSMRPVQRGVVLVAALVVGGCSLLVDIGGYAGGGGAATDAAPQVDAPTSEAGTTIDGGDAAPRPFCASQSPAPFFCVDFDDGRPVTSAWEGTIETSGLLEADPLAVSPTRSMRALLKEPGGACEVGAFGWRTVPGIDMHVRFAVRLGDVAGTGGFAGASISELDVVKDTNTCKFFFIPDGAGRAVVQRQRFAPAFSATDSPMTLAPRLGAWSVVDEYVSATSAGGPATLRIVVDGKEALVSTFPECPVAGMSANFGVYSCSGTSEARYDDVTIEIP
jgi:hypothetical protein